MNLRRVKHEFPQIFSQNILRMGFKAINNTMSKNGLVPLLMTFFIIPRFPMLNIEPPTTRLRMEALKKAQGVMNSIATVMRIR